MSLSSTNRVSAAEAGIRDPFRELSKLLVSPDVEIGYQHWPSWYDLIGHIEEEYTGWVLTKTQVFGPPEMSKDSTPMEKSPGRTPITPENAKEGDSLAVQAAQRYNEAVDEAKSDLYSQLSRPSLSNGGPSHPHQWAYPAIQNLQPSSSYGMHNGVAGPYDISEDSIEWQLLTVKDMLMAVQRMTQVSELGYNTCLDSSKRHGPLAILNASTLRRLRHIFAERASITNDGLLRTILWVDIDEKNNFFDNFGSPTGRQAFLDEYIRWLDTWKATLQYWEKMLDERKSFPPVPDSYISYGHHTQPNLPLAHPAIQGLWQSQVWGSGYGL